MRKKSGLRFTSEQQKKTKRFRAFIVAFVAFVLVLGSISTLIFLKSVNFDMQNLLQSPENTVTTTEPSTAPAPTVTVRDATVLLVCCDSDEKLTLAAIVRADAAQNAVTVRALETDASVSSLNGLSLQTVFEKNGMAGLKSAVASVYQLQIDRYIKTTETNLQKAISAVGDIPVSISAPIAYRGADFSLFLDAGEQNLTGDLFVKYLRFSDANGRAEATAALVTAVLQSLYGENREAQFNTLFNLSDTDFSIVDLTDSNGLVHVFVALRNTVAVYMQ